MNQRISIAIIAVAALAFSMTGFVEGSPIYYGAIPPTYSFANFNANGTIVASDAYNDVLNVTSDGSILIVGTDTPNTGSPFSAWNYKKSLLLNSTMISADISGFPALVWITDADLASHAQTDGDDILFTMSDEVTQIPHEIESWNSTSGELVAWVKTDVEDLTDTSIYVMFGNALAADQQDAHSVWDDSYIAVYHMDDANDSTQYNNDLSVSGVISEAGQVGMAYRFDGIADYMQRLAFNGTLTDYPYTFESLYSSDAFVQIQSIVDLTTVTSSTDNQALRLRHDGDGAGGGGGSTPVQNTFRRDGGTPSNAYGTNTLSATTFYHGSMTATSDAVAALYLDGTLDNSDTANRNFGTATDIAIGMVGDSTPGNYFDGLLDEIRISNVVRSDDWLLTSATMQLDPASFVTVGSLEAVTVEDSIVFSLNTPGASTIGGVFSDSCGASEAVTAINANGTITCTVISGGGGGNSTTHTLLNATSHTDTVTQSPTRGSIVYGDSTPEWNELVLGTNGQVLSSDGTDIAWNLVGSEQAEDDLITGQSSMTGFSPVDEAADYILISDGGGGLMKVDWSNYMETINLLTGVTPEPDDELLIYDNSSSSVKKITVGDMFVPTDIVIKSADESVVSSTTLQNDDHISFPVDANSLYTYKLFTIFTGHASYDIKLGWSYPTGTAMHRIGSGFDNSNDYDENDTMRLQAQGSNNATQIIYGNIRTEATAGTMQLQWAQQSSGATPTVLYTDSHIIVWKLQ